MIFGNVRLKHPKLPRLGRLWWHKMLPRREGANPVALSVAVGVFIGLMPTFGVALVLTIATLELFKLPKLPGCISSFIAVPPTIFPFFYPLGYWTGRHLVETRPLAIDLLGTLKGMSLAETPETLKMLAAVAGDHLLAFFVGMTIVATAFAVLFYFLAYWAMRAKNAKFLRDRAERRKAKLAAREGREEGRGE